MLRAAPLVWYWRETKKTVPFAVGLHNLIFIFVLTSSILVLHSLTECAYAFLLYGFI